MINNNNNNMEATMQNIRPFKKIQKFDVIENDNVIHLFKITHLDNSTAVYDNDGNLVMKSKIVHLLPKDILDKANALGKKMDETFNKPNNNNGGNNAKE